MHKKVVFFLVSYHYYSALNSPKKYDIFRIGFVGEWRLFVRRQLADSKQYFLYFCMRALVVSSSWIAVERDHDFEKKVGVFPAVWTFWGVLILTARKRY